MEQADLGVFVRLGDADLARLGLEGKTPAEIRAFLLELVSSRLSGALGVPVFPVAGRDGHKPYPSVYVSLR